MTWVTIPQGDSESLANTVEATIQGRIKAGAFSENDVRNIKNRALELIPKDLDLPPLQLEKLRRLCQLWEVDIRASEITSHRKFIGPIIVSFKKLLFPLIRFVLKDFIREQRDFNAQVISFVAELANESQRKNR